MKLARLPQPRLPLTHLIGPNVSLINRGGPGKAGPRASGTSTSSGDTKPTDGWRRRLAGRTNSGVWCREGRETPTLSAGWTLSKCPGKEAAPKAGPLGLAAAEVDARYASKGCGDLHGISNGRRMKPWRAPKVEASFILPVPPASCDKRERQIDRDLKVPVLAGQVYSTKVLSDRVCLVSTAQDLRPPCAAPLTAAGASDAIVRTFLLRGVALSAGRSGVAARAGPSRPDDMRQNPKVNNLGVRVWARWLQFRSRPRSARHPSLRP
jgi:hypothetical protein